MENKDYKKMRISFWITFALFWIIGFSPDILFVNCIGILAMAFFSIYNFVFAIKVLKKTKNRVFPICCIVFDSFIFLQLLVGFAIGILLGVVSYV